MSHLRQGVQRHLQTLLAQLGRRAQSVYVKEKIEVDRFREFGRIHSELAAETAEFRLVSVRQKMNAQQTALDRRKSVVLLPSGKRNRQIEARCE